MKKIEDYELFLEIKNDIPYTFGFLWRDIEKCIDGTISVGQLKEEIKDQLIDMEIATSPATIREIDQVREEGKYLVEFLLESNI